MTIESSINHKTILTGNLTLDLTEQQRLARSRFADTSVAVQRLTNNFSQIYSQLKPIVGGVTFGGNWDVRFPNVIRFNEQGEAIFTLELLPDDLFANTLYTKEEYLDAIVSYKRQIEQAENDNLPAKLAIIQQLNNIVR